MHIFIYSSRISLVVKVSAVRNWTVALRFMFWVPTCSCEKHAASCSPFLLFDADSAAGYL